MNGEPGPFAGIDARSPLGPMPITVSAAANERYWRAAGLDHPLLRDGWLYPAVAANLTILLFQTACSTPVLHAAQRLVCHTKGRSGSELTVTGSVAERYEKRGRAYAVVEADVRLPGDELLWTSIATFTPVAP